MPIQAGNIIIATPDGKLQFYPSESLYNETSSAPSIPAEYEIQVPITLQHFSSSLLNSEISRSGLNNDPIVEPFIRLTLLTGSFTGEDPEELIIRFFTESHFNPNKIDEGFFDNPSFGLDVDPQSASLYFTASLTSSRVRYHDILVENTILSKGDENAFKVRNKISDAITSSKYFINGDISQSNFGFNTSSIYYSRIKGATIAPFFHTGSMHADSGSGFKAKTVNSGSGTSLNFSEAYVMSEASSSFSIETDPNDGNSIIFNIGTSSLGYVKGAGETLKDPTKLYFSGSGRIGFGTKDPEADIDFRAESFLIQKPGTRKGLQVNDEGNIESFNKDAASSATGSEFILKYSRGTAITAVNINDIVGETVVENDEEAVLYLDSLGPDEKTRILNEMERAGLTSLPSVGDTIGSLRFVAESGSVGFNDRTTGEAASISTKVHSSDATGVRGDLIFSVADQTGTSVQRMILDAGDAHEISGSLSIGGTTTTAGNLRIDGAGGNQMFQVSRYGANSADQKIGQLRLYDDGNTKLRFSAKGQSFITATNDGTHTTGARLGIETTDPKVELEVIGDISASGTITGLTGSFTKGIINLPSATANEKIFQVQKAGSNVFYVDEDGDGVFGGVIEFKNYIYGSNGNTFVGGRQDLVLGMNWNNDEDGTSIKFTKNELNNSPSNTLMLISSSGNVGIGTTTPSQKLEVNGNIALTGNEQWIGNSANNSANKIKFFGSSDTMDLITGDSSAYDGWDFLSGTTSRVRITRLGNVGIGTTGPGEKLEVVGNISASGDLYGDDLILGTGRITTANTHIDYSGTPLTGITNITASGDISASGNVLADWAVANRVYIGPHAASARLTFDDTSVVNNMGLLNQGHITASGDISSSGTVKADKFTGIFIGAFSGSGQIDHDSTTNFVANEHIDHSGVTITAGDGLTGGGTIAATRTLNVVGGTGVTANANDIAIGQDVALDADVTFGTVTSAGSEVTSDGNAFVRISTTNSSTNRQVGLILSSSVNGLNYTLGLNREKDSFYIGAQSLGVPSPLFELDSVGNITASGNISSSGDLYGSNATIAGTLYLGGENRIDYNNDDIRFIDTGINVVGGHITASANISASGHIITNTLRGSTSGDQSGSLTLSGSLTFKANIAKPSVSASTLFVHKELNHTADDTDLRYSNSGLTPSFGFFSMDGSGTDDSNENPFGKGAGSVTSTTHNMTHTFVNGSEGVRAYIHLDGIYKIHGTLICESSTVITNAEISLRKDGSDVFATTIAVHSSVDPVERSFLGVTTVDSGSYIDVTLGTPSSAGNLNMKAGSTFMVERLA